MSHDTYGYFIINAVCHSDLAQHTHLRTEWEEPFKEGIQGKKQL